MSYCFIIVFTIQQNIKNNKRKKMKEFLHLVGELMNQLDLKCEYCENTIISMKVAYEKLSKEEKQKSLALLDELLQEDYHSYFFIF